MPPTGSYDYQLTTTTVWDITIGPDSLILHTLDDESADLANPTWSPGAPLI